MNDRYLPNRSGEAFEERFRDTHLAADFQVIAELVERCVPSSEQALLLLTTCRNHLMTVNAVFVDIREVVGASTLPSPLGQAARAYQAGDWHQAAKPIRVVRELLGIGKAKLATWDERQRLSGLIDETIETFAQVDRDRIRALLGLNLDRTRGVPLALRPTDYDPSVTAPYAEDLLGTLRRGVDSLDAISGLAMHLGTSLQLGALKGKDSASQLFELPELEEDRQRVERSLLSVRSILTGDVWRGTPVPDSSRISLPGHGEFDLDEQVDRRDLVAIIASRLARTGDDVRADLKIHFSSNSARAPMPAPFVIDLAPPITANELNLATDRVDAGGGHVGGSIRVAALRCGIAEDWYEADNSAYQIVPAKVDILVQLLRQSIREAAANNASMLVLPEVFMPAAAIEIAKQLADEHSMVVVGGVEMHREPHGIVNHALVILPGGVHEQRKQRPSVYEVRQNEFASDGTVRIFAGTPAGVFAVAICSDYLEHDLLHTLESEEHLDLVVVCSRNPNPDVFRYLAASDAYRHYTHVVIANACPATGGVPANGDGTLAASPLRDSPFVEPAQEVELGMRAEFEPSDPPSLSVFELSFDAIAHRKNNRPDRGFLSPSYFARR